MNKDERRQMGRKQIPQIFPKNKVTISVAKKLKKNQTIKKKSPIMKYLI